MDENYLVDNILYIATIEYPLLNAISIKNPILGNIFRDS